MTNTEFRIGDEVRLSISTQDPFYRHYHDKVGVLTRIEESDDHFTGTAGYYVNVRSPNLPAFRAGLSEISPYVRDGSEEDPVDAIRSELSEDPSAFIDNAPAHVLRLLAIIDAIEAECADAEAHAAYSSSTPKVGTESIRRIIRDFS